MENWKDIKNYEGLYRVSNEGNVLSVRRNNVLKGGKNGGGYLHVVLCKNGIMKNKMIHRLVAEAFIPNPNNLSQVNHKDEDKTNNRVENLEWCDCSYNVNFGTRNEKVAENLINGIASKQVYQYTLDGELIRIWSSTRECGRNGFDQSHVAACCRNHYNREGNNIYKGYIWRYYRI